MFSRSPLVITAVAVAAAALAFQSPIRAQDRLKSMPGYEQYERMSREIPASVTLGSIVPQWSDDGSSFEYVFAGKRYNFDLASKKATVIGDAPAGTGRGGRGGQFAGGQRD